MRIYIWTVSQKKNELSHHGIEGQKWGVRRYQNPDGSLTPAGRERYSYSEYREFVRDRRRFRQEDKAELKKLIENGKDTDDLTRKERKKVNKITADIASTSRLVQKYGNQKVVNYTAAHKVAGATAIATILASPLAGVTVGAIVAAKERSKYEKTRAMFARPGEYDEYDKKPVVYLGGARRP